MPKLQHAFDEGSAHESSDLEIYKTEELKSYNRQIVSILHGDEDLVRLYRAAGIIEDYDYNKMSDDLKIPSEDVLFSKFESGTADRHGGIIESLLGSMGILKLR